MDAQSIGIVIAGIIGIVIALKVCKTVLKWGITIGIIFVVWQYLSINGVIEQVMEYLS